GGRGAAHAAIELRKKALAIAADHLEAAIEDLTIEDGRVRVRGAPGSGLSLGEVAAIATAPRPGYALPGGMDPGLDASAYGHVTQSTYSSAPPAPRVQGHVDT